MNRRLVNSGLLRRLRTLAALGIGGCAAVPLAAGGGPTSPRSNVLLIVLDDANDWISPLGHAAQTPHLQRLAERGTVFTRAYCAAPGCGPSRAALLTGVSPASSGIYFNSQPFRRSGAAIARAVSLPAHFRAHGYVTAGYGKVFHHGEDERAGWEPGVVWLAESIFGPP